MEEEQGIYRGEVITIMSVLADIRSKVDAILDAIEGDDGEEEAEDPRDA